MTIYYVADHDINDYPGGAEKVDYNIYFYLNIEYKKSTNFLYNSNDFYIISNATSIPNEQKNKLINNKNYIIFEHDYKMHFTRQPHRYAQNIFPKDELINLDYYKNAKAVILQSLDHLNCFKANNIEGNLLNFSTSIWSKKELDTLESLSNLTKKTYRACIIGNPGVDKGRDIAEAICKSHRIDYDIIPTMDLISFYNKLAEYPLLVNTPRVKESFCRLVVEARCLNMNVLSHFLYGAMSEPWFSLSGIELISFLRESSRKNIETIKNLV